MAYDNVHVLKIVRRILDDCERPQAALRVWSVLQLDSGPGQRVEFARDQLAEMAGVPVWDVSRAISALEKIGALDRSETENSQRGRGPISVILRRFW